MLVRDDLFEEIQSIIEDIAEIPKESIKEDSAILADLELNSLSVLTLISELEEEYHLQISESDLMNIITIGDLLDLICRLASE